MHPFFESEHAKLWRNQVETADEFYHLVERLLGQLGLTDVAMTIFDLEDLLIEHVGFEGTLLMQTMELLTRPGREHTSLTEMHSLKLDYQHACFQAAFQAYSAEEHSL